MSAPHTSLLATKRCHAVCGKNVTAKQEGDGPNRRLLSPIF